MKVLNLYAGIGGNRKLWEDVEVTAVEIVPEIAEVYQDFFPNDTMVIDDAHQYLLNNYKDFDFIWASPPCPTHSRMRRWMQVDYTVEAVYPDMTLWQEIIFLRSHFDGKYCVENVISYYDPLIKPQTIGRHYYWTNFMIRESKPVESRTVRDRTKEELMEIHGFDLTKYVNLKNKRKILRNCADPKIGEIILDSARGNTQHPLTAFSKTKRISE